MAISNGYSTLAEVKSALRITDSLDDSMLEMAVESASRLIDGYANRSFYNAGTAVRYFVADNDYLTNIDDAITITEIATDSSADGTYDIIWQASDYQLEPLNGRVDGLPAPYNAIRAIGDYTFPIWGDEGLVKVTGTWGFSSIPISIRQACIIQASRIYKRLDSPLGIAGFGDIGVMRISRQLDPDVAQLVDAYKIVKFA